MSVIDFCLAAILALWAVGSVLFLARVPLPGGWLGRLARLGCFVRWGVFSNKDPARRAGTFELVVRDWTDPAAPPAWRTVASGACPSRRAFFWLPQRHLASALQNLGRQTKVALERSPPATTVLTAAAHRLGAYVARREPAAPGVRREIRLLRTFPGGGAAPEVILAIPPPSPRWKST